MQLERLGVDGAVIEHMLMLTQSQLFVSVDVDAAVESMIHHIVELLLAYF